MADIGGRTTKRTYVTTYTTDVDPRTLPDFASRGIATGSDEENNRVHPHDHHSRNTIQNGSTWQDDAQRAPRGHAGAAAAPAHTQRGAPAPLPMPPQLHHHASSPSPPSSTAESVDGHRLRKKYTTTTVTTITTTTVLLPTMQEAYVFPSVTSHRMDQQADAHPAITNGNGYPTGGPQQERVYQVDSSHASSTSASPDRHYRQQQQLQSSGADIAVRGNGRLVPAQPQYRPDGSAAQTWVFHQQSAHQVETEEGRGRLPTLAELGITSYFGTEGGSGRGQQQQQQQLRAAPYAAAPARGADPQPWVATETRHEVEGGRRYY